MWTDKWTNKWTYKWTDKLIGALAGLALIGSAAAQTMPTQPQTPTQGTLPQTSPPIGTPAPATMPKFLRLQSENERLTSELIGMPVYGIGGETLGKIAHLIIDRNNRAVGAVVSVGGLLGLGTKSVAVPWQALRFETLNAKESIVLPMSGEELANAPEYKSLAQLRLDVESEQAKQDQKQRAMQPPRPAGPPAKPAM